MAQVYQNIGNIILMLVLLAGSAFLSGAETSFFNLSRRQISLLQKSDHKLKRLVATLLSKPNQLLGCLLFGNMTINILFYAVACVFTISVEQQVGVKTAAVTAFLAFISLILSAKFCRSTSPMEILNFSALPLRCRHFYFCRFSSRLHLFSGF